jgi:hypothetical protein
MEKVLIAIEGMHPNRQLLCYAAGLCRRIKAELNVLHIIHPKAHAAARKNLQHQARKAQTMFEGSMMAAAFAETGEFDTAKSLADKARAKIKNILADADQTAVPCRVEISSGEAGPEITRFIDRHRGVILAIYDDSAAAPPMAAAAEASPETPGELLEQPIVVPKVNAPQLQKSLSVPLVVRRMREDGK